MPSYHFSLGNSSKGPVGFCLRIIADNPEEAVDKLIDRMPTEIEVDLGDGLEQEEYMTVYLNLDAVTTKDIDEVNTVGEVN